MAGSGAAVRLHEFRASQDDTVTTKPSRPGRDVHGLYPGQLGRVHVVHSKDCGSASLQALIPPSGNFRQSFDVVTLRALTLLHPSPAVLEQPPPQTVYQDHFGLQALFPQ